MKKILFLGLCIMISFITLGQVKKEFVDEIKGVSVSPPTFLGVMQPSQNVKNNSLNEYLSKELQYPEESKTRMKEGTVVVQFAVSTSGQLSDFNVVNSVSPEIDKEVIRALKTTDKMWNPGSSNNSPVAMESEVSVAFIIGEGSVNTKELADHAKHYFDKGSKKMFLEENCKGALKCYDKAVCYLPNDKCILLTRGICKYELGDKQGACQDWNRVKTLGGGDIYLKDLCEFKGYAEMINTLQKKEYR